MKRTYVSRILAPLLIAAVAFSTFFRMNGSGNVRAVHIVILLGIGMCLGVALTHSLSRTGRQFQ